MNKDPNIHEDFATVEDTSHYDRDIDDLQDVNHYIDAFDIIPNAFTVLGCHEDHIFPFKNPKHDQQIDISADDSFGSAANTMGNLQLSDLQTKGKL